MCIVRLNLYFSDTEKWTVLKLHTVEIRKIVYLAGNQHIYALEASIW